MSARLTGTVSHIGVGFGEITTPGWQPILCELRDLERIGADEIGIIVDYAHGTLGGKHDISGAVNITRPAVAR